MLKILFFHNTLAEYRKGWFTELDRKEYVTFVFTNHAEYIEKYNLGDIAADLKSIKFISSGLKGFCELKKIIKNVEKYDFVELPPVDTFHEFVISIYILKKCFRKKIKIGYFWEKWEPPKNKQPFKRRIKNYILGMAAYSIYCHADIIFAGGSKARDYFMSHGIEYDKITVLPNTSSCPMCDYDDIRKKYNITNDKKILLYFGRIMPEKGLDKLLIAFSKIENIDNCFLLIAGDGEFKSYCERLAIQLHLKNICFAGKVAPSIRANYFMQCDAFIFPGTYYGGWVDVWGLTVNEAIQFYKPVISTYGVGSAIDLIKNGVNGYLINPDSIEELSYTINRIMSEKLNDCKNIDKRLLTKYNFDNMAKVYCHRIINEL